MTLNDIEYLKHSHDEECSGGANQGKEFNIVDFLLLVEEKTMVVVK